MLDYLVAIIGVVIFVLGFAESQKKRRIMLGLGAGLFVLGFLGIALSTVSSEGFRIDSKVALKIQELIKNAKPVIADADSSQPSDKKRKFTPKQEIIRTIGTWHGRSNKQTETFKINSSEWMLAWNTEPQKGFEGIFQIFVHRASGDLICVAANVIGKDADSTVMRGAGNFYLEINATQPWGVVVKGY